MNYKHNINFFKKSDTLRIVGLVLAVVGLLMLWLGMSYLTYILMAIFIPAGVIMFLVGSSGRASESDIDADIKRQIEGFDTDLSEDKKYSKRILKHLPVEVIRGEEFTESSMLTKNKTGTVRSSDHTVSAVHILSDCLYIRTRTVSVVCDNVRDMTYEIPYELITSLEIVRDTQNYSFDKKSFRISTARFTVIYNDGLKISLPIHDDVGADGLIEKIERVIRDRKTETN